MKLTADRPYADPNKAARKILEIAKAIEPKTAASTSKRSTSRSSTRSAARRQGARRFYLCMAGERWALPDK
jgi:hypothetical protein